MLPERVNAPVHTEAGVVYGISEKQGTVIQRNTRILVRNKRAVDISKTLHSILLFVNEKKPFTNGIFCVRISVNYIREEICI